MLWTKQSLRQNKIRPIFRFKSEKEGFYVMLAAIMMLSHTFSLLKRWNGASSKFFIFWFFFGGRESVKQKRKTKNQGRSVFIKTISKKCEDDQIRGLWRLFFILLYDVKNSAILNTTQYQHKRLTFSTKTHKLRTGDKWQDRKELGLWLTRQALQNLGSIGG